MTLLLLILLQEALEKQSLHLYRLPLPYERFEFDIDQWDETTTLYRTRFTKRQFYQLLPHLALDQIAWTNRYTATPEFALALLCTRLAWPNRLSDIASLFGRGISKLSSIFSDIVMHVVSRYKTILQWHPCLANQRRILWCAKEINDYEPQTDSTIWAFLDGTFMATCRPTGGQREFYSGHKKQHGIKFQAVVYTRWNYSVTCRAASRQRKR